MFRAFCVLLAVAALAVVIQCQDTEKPILRVDVFYEALCDDSDHFIRKELYRAMVKKNLLQYADLHFVPFGKVTILTDPETGETSFICQHAHMECEKNAFHACIVEHNSVPEQLEMINCLMHSSRDVEKCEKRTNVNVTEAKQCKTSRSIVDILTPYKDLTEAVPITFIPTILLDGKFDSSTQKFIRKDFRKAFCQAFEAKFSMKLDEC